MRTIIYVDGLNLYYRCLRGTQFKWLDLNQLFTNLLDPKYQITQINYFYADVKLLPYDLEARNRQAVYINALKTCNNITFHNGNFIKHKAEMHIWDDPASIVEVIWVEEKCSDVNLATNLLNDAWKDQYDAAFVVSSDSDLKDGMRLVKQEFQHKEVNLITPGPRREANKKLKQIADHHLEIFREISAWHNFPIPFPEQEQQNHRDGNVNHVLLPVYRHLNLP